MLTHLVSSPPREVALLPAASRSWYAVPMNESQPCPECGAELPATATICRQCGWDQTTAIARPPKMSLGATIRAGGWRVIVYGLIVVLPILGFQRLRTTGLGPDLMTTLRWMAFGDGGRAAELETINRMHETASAAARYGVREMSVPPFDGDWAAALAPSATMHVRGWIPLVIYSADTRMAPASVRELYEVRAVDGWGRPYEVAVRTLPRGPIWEDDPEVAADLEKGLQKNFFSLGEPDFEHGDWIRLEMRSAGADGDFATADDLRMVSYLRIGHVFQLILEPEEVQRQLERDYAVGQHYWRIEGSRWDLIDARLLAEYRLTSIY